MVNSTSIWMPAIWWLC